MSICQCSCATSGCAKPVPFFDGLPFHFDRSPACLSTRHAGRAHRHDIGIQHHERQPPVALHRILQMAFDDDPLLPLLQPKIAGNPTVVFVDAAVAFSPIVELAAAHAQPLHEPPDADLAGVRPAPDEIHNLVPHIVRHPDPVQSSPSSFFSATCSAINSARTSSLRWIFFSKNAMRSFSPWWSLRTLLWKAAAPFSNSSFCQR